MKRNPLKLKTVGLFIEASKIYNWTSGYSKGELIQVRYFDGTDTMVIYEDDRREYYTGRASRFEARHGSLTLNIDGSGSRNKYEVIEVSVREKKTFCWDCEAKRRDDLRKGIITMNNYLLFKESFRSTSKYRRGNSSAGLGRLASYTPEVEINRYWDHSDVTYHYVEIESKGGEVTDVRKQWEKMKQNGKFVYHHSPCRGSVSEYLVNHETGDIYRYSDHWGSGIKNCNWYLERNGDSCNGEAIGCANIREFKSNMVVKARLYTSSEIEKLSSAIDEEIDFLETSKKTYTCEDGVTELLDKDICELRDRKKRLRTDYDSYGQNHIAFFKSKIAGILENEKKSNLGHIRWW